jgi:hypothetical protein
MRKENNTRYHVLTVVILASLISTIIVTSLKIKHEKNTHSRPVYRADKLHTK